MAPQPLSICVYCGSRPGRDPAYIDAAAAFGRAIAQNGWRLVYGAGDVGMMGKVATAANAGGAAMLGVIPGHLVSREAPDGRFGQRIVTETMHERKKVMIMNADVAVVLPGGAGSLDEFFEVLTWRQLGLHNKPIYLLNINDFWDPLNLLLDHIIAEGFADRSLAALVRSVPDVDELVAVLKSDENRRR